MIVLRRRGDIHLTRSFGGLQGAIINEAVVHRAGALHGERTTHHRARSASIGRVKHELQMSATLAAGIVLLHLVGDHGLVTLGTVNMDLTALHTSVHRHSRDAVIRVYLLMVSRSAVSITIHDSLWRILDARRASTMTDARSQSLVEVGARLNTIEVTEGAGVARA